VDEREIFAVVRESILQVLPELAGERVSMDGTLADLGCNSIDRADVVVMTMERLRIAVPVAEFRSVNDIRSLVGVLQRFA
jgi:polyketide biosynthesis acyl carrier protein